MKSGLGSPANPPFSLAINGATANKPIGFVPLRESIKSWDFAPQLLSSRALGKPYGGTNMRGGFKMQDSNIRCPRSLWLFQYHPRRKIRKSLVKSAPYTLTNRYPLISHAPIASYLILDPPPVSGPAPDTNRLWMKSENCPNHRPDCWRIIR